MTRGGDEQVPQNFTAPHLSPEESFSVMQARREAVRTQLGYAGLSECYLEHLDRNPSGALPYHGNERQLALAAIAVGAGWVEGFSFRRQEALFLAALFSHAAYTPGAGAAANHAAAVRFSDPIVKELDPRRRRRVRSLLRAVHFPARKTRSREAHLLRDAQLLLMAQPDFGNFLEAAAQEAVSKSAVLPASGDAFTTFWGRHLYELSLELHRTPERVRYPLEERVGLGATHHAQRLTSRGFAVDRGIHQLLEELWKQGYETIYCCEGDSTYTSPGFYTPIDGYIAFVQLSEEHLKRIEAAAAAVGRELSYLARSPQGRATVLRFWHRELPQVAAILLAEETGA
jgi:hypothetical protein